MTVADLIKRLQLFPRELPVAYRFHSDQALLEANDIKIESLCEARADGWLQNARPDMPTRQYVVFPGN